MMMDAMQASSNSMEPLFKKNGTGVENETKAKNYASNFPNCLLG
jgi:hypothetical protein